MSQFPLFDTTKEIGIGCLAGVASGYTVKQVSKVLALLIGVSFVGVQAARSKGWITPHWDKMQTELVQNCDMNGDGKITFEDLQIGIQKLTNFLGAGLPSVSSFLAGFYFGLKL